MTPIEEAREFVLQCVFHSALASDQNGGIFGGDIERTSTTPDMAIALTPSIVSWSDGLPK